MSTIPIVSVEEAWFSLASDVLQLAIKDARENRDPYQREKAKTWLLSVAAKLLFDSLISEFDINIEDWVKAGCPTLGKK